MTEMAFEPDDLYILDAHGAPHQVRDLNEWAQWMTEHPEEQVVAQDHAEGPRQPPIRISTRFFGVDLRLLPEFQPGPPVLWETMVFGGALHLTQRRYTSRADALAGHQAICQQVNATLRDKEPQG